MRFLRSVVGYRLKDKKTNNEIRQELNIMDLNLKIKQRCWECIQHVQRMDPYQLPRKAIVYRPKGRRSIACPTIHWEVQLDNLEPA
jgi:hypothetical protein